MEYIFILFFSLIKLSLFLSIGRFLTCLIILEKFKVVILLFSLLQTNIDKHILFILIMIISTIEVIVGLVILTRVWECSSSLDLAFF